MREAAKTASREQIPPARMERLRLATFTCPLCLTANSADLLRDRHGGHYFVCCVCNVRAFLRSARAECAVRAWIALRGTAEGGRVLDDLAAHLVAHGADFIPGGAQFGAPKTEEAP